MSQSTMPRRQFLKTGAMGGLALAGAMTEASARDRSDTKPVLTAHDCPDTRAYWSDLLYRFASPVLSQIAVGKLKQTMVVETSPIWDGRNRDVAYLECFGRLMSSLAPWLSLPDTADAEGKRRHTLRQWALAGYANSVNPKSPDYFLWRKEGQPLVDSAYFSNALLRAPDALWHPLDSTTKKHIVTELKGLRRVDPPYTNWLLFAAMNEAFLLSIGEDYDPMRINLAVRKINEWYVGDGWYSDGERFHTDYYNAYVIQPMLIEILSVLVKTHTSINGVRTKDLYDLAVQRCQRFSEVLERMVSPEGTFPPLGRSTTYRTAVFQPLALLSWRKELPPSLPEGQVRAALSAVHHRIFSAADNFTPDGFLTLGFVGHRPEIADSYSNSGSMYVTGESFLPLGLAADDSFWTAPPQPWTGKRAYANTPFPRDHALKD